jgi:uncharacterized membrane protein
MKRALPGWLPFALFIVCFITFGITKLNVIGVAADIFFLISLVEGVLYLKRRRNE